jgi:DNA-binding MarR family transcriptional regulator
LKDSDFDLDGFLPYQFNVIAGRLSRGFARRYRTRFGISIAEWRVVAHLSQAGAVSVREIHERADMDKSKVSRAAARLEAAGYITKRPSSVDRRLVELALTPDGEAMMTELIAMARAYQAQILQSLGPDAQKFRDGVNVLMHTRF